MNKSDILLAVLFAGIILIVLIASADQPPEVPDTVTTETTAAAVEITTVEETQVLTESETVAETETVTQTEAVTEEAGAEFDLQGFVLTDPDMAIEITVSGSRYYFLDERISLEDIEAIVKMIGKNAVVIITDDNAALNTYNDLTEMLKRHSAKVETR